MKDVKAIQKSVTTGEGVELEKVRKFSYLGDMLDANGGVDSAVTDLLYTSTCSEETLTDVTPLGRSEMHHKLEFILHFRPP
jgi:hypothetical protein